jgi:hypothetical protein
MKEIVTERLVLRLLAGDDVRRSKQNAKAPRLRGLRAVGDGAVTVIVGG